MIMIQKGGYAMKIDLVNELNSLELMNEWLDKIAVELKMAEEQCYQVKLALEEALVNVINYAYPGKKNQPIWLEAELISDSVHFTLIDEGIPFDPTKQEIPDITVPLEEREIGGLGILLIKELMREIHYVYKDGRNYFKMTYQL